MWAIIADIIQGYLLIGVTIVVVVLMQATAREEFSAASLPGQIAYVLAFILGWPLIIFSSDNSDYDDYDHFSD